MIVSRSPEPTLLLDAAGFLEVNAPGWRSPTPAAPAIRSPRAWRPASPAARAVRDAIVTGAAAAALNVTRHGLGTGDPETIAALRAAVTVREIVDEAEAGIAQPVTGHVSPDGLAALAEPAAPAETGGQR